MALLAMEFFRSLGDLCHLCSLFSLIYRIVSIRSAADLSFKTQFLYLIVFSTRYLDILFFKRSTYNIAMKLFFFFSQSVILYLISSPYKPTWAKLVDTFPLYLLIVPPAIITLLWPISGHKDRSFLWLPWEYSYLLESVAILPQLLIIRRVGKAETITANYLVLLGLYRIFYIVSWLLRVIFKMGGVAPQIVLAGILQTALYIDVFYLYFTKVFKGQKFILPS